MKSSIKIDYMDRGTGKGMEPVIKIILIKSDDPRDTLISYLFESLGQIPSIQISFPSSGLEIGGDSYQNILLFKPE